MKNRGSRSKSVKCDKGRLVTLDSSSTCRRALNSVGEGKKTSNNIVQGQGSNAESIFFDFFQASPRAWAFMLQRRTSSTRLKDQSRIPDRQFSHAHEHPDRLSRKSATSRGAFDVTNEMGALVKKPLLLAFVVLDSFYRTTVKEPVEQYVKIQL
ncbi:hypothetical protein CROQUDRAFT_109463 [Cronartium quercuum f. sp. fusiforme G11]|uniref:Uncharacterized protein n=1 Tax=Cronartium quercuum f. sp. fusiforme G11 TaxID=708437 RepID=A0A9P6T8H7_9BASI|nr:hypothetical protein CROQUDRAFT_109463 [Cronartium quercuum f. sp. fusiforme G11]